MHNLLPLYTTTKSNSVTPPGEYVGNLWVLAAAGLPRRCCQCHAPYGPLCKNMTLSRKPNIHNDIFCDTVYIRYNHMMCVGQRIIRQHYSACIPIAEWSALIKLFVDAMKTSKSSISGTYSTSNAFLHLTCFNRPDAIFHISTPG